MEDILVSVIIPTYNREKLILRSLNSVLNQSYKNFEVIVVDDGSTDNTAKILQELTDERVKIFKTENQGANAARNFGIKKAIGELIAFNDSDDEWHPEKLSKQVNFLIENKFDAVFCQMIVKKGNKGHLFPKKMNEKNKLKDLIFFYNFIGTPALLLKKELFSEIGSFDENLPRMQDWDFAIRLCNKSNVGYQKIPLVNVYLGNNSISENNSFIEPSIDIIFQKYQCFIKNLPKNIQAKTFLKYVRFYTKAKSFDKAFNHLKNVKQFNKEFILTIIYFYYEKFKTRFHRL